MIYLNKYNKAKTELSDVFYLGLRKVLIFYFGYLFLYLVIICLPVNIYYLIFDFSGIKKGIDLIMPAPLVPFIFLLFSAMYSFLSLLTNKDLVTKQGSKLAGKNSFENGVMALYYSLYLLIPLVKFIYYYYKIKHTDK